jgi:hypothetical protein
MSSEKPDQIQASVAAALSRLRGDLGPSGAAAPKIEEQQEGERARPANDVRGDPFFRSIQSQQGRGAGQGYAPIPMTPFPRMQATQAPAPDTAAGEEQGATPEQGGAIDMPDMPEQAVSYEPVSASAAEPIEPGEPFPIASEAAALQSKAPGSASPFSRVLSRNQSSDAVDPVQPDLLTELPPPPISEPLTSDPDAGAMRRRRRNRRLLALAAVIIMAAIGAWWWTNRTPSTDVPVITADATPEKVKPAEEGGLQVQNQDVQVLDPSAQSQGETVMPEPEQPITPPASGAGQAPTVVDSGQGAPATTADTQPAPGVPLSETPLPAFEENGTTTKTEPTPAEPAAPAVSAPEPTQTAEAPATTETAPAQSAAEPTTAPEATPSAQPMQTAQPEAAQPQPEPVQTAQPETAQPAQPETQLAQPEATQQAAATPAAPAPTAATDNTRIQLAAGKSEASVQKEWAALQKAHPQLLGDLSLTIERVDKGTAGVFYRLQAGPLADKTAARQVCASLKQRGQDCIVVGK